MRAQAAGGTAKSGYKKLKSEQPKKTLRKERVQITSAMGKSGYTRGGVGAKRKKK